MPHRKGHRIPGGKLDVAARRAEEERAEAAIRKDPEVKEKPVVFKDKFAIPAEEDPELAAQQALEREQRELEAPQREREIIGKKFLEEQEFFEETRPEEVDLTLPERKGIERVPIIGPGLAALGGVFKRNIKGELEDDAKKAFGISDSEQLETIIQNPETARELAKQEIQKEVIAEATTGSEDFGALVESIPIVGGLVAKYAGALIESPRENVDTIVAEVSKMGNRATNMREKALTGKMGDPFIAFDQIVQMENNMARMKQRIKILSQESAQLTADADALNLIEETILDAEQRIFDAKQSAAAGIIAPVTDSNIFLTLKELKGA